MPIGFNRSLAPQGGRYFIDEDGVKHKAENWDFLALRLANYRKRAGKPPGNPAAEILAQVCARQPNYCQETGPGPTPPPPTHRVNADGERGSSGKLTERVLKWLAHVIGMRRAGGAQRVSSSEAARRAAICAGCVYNRILNESCGSCNRTRKMAAEALIGGARVNTKLGGCKILSQDNRIATHLDLPKPSEEGLPGHCWRK